tara:strand:- start:676 stop:1101 length:426 start_codon:yes stop_codon:yes gene_type:complete
MDLVNLNKVLTDIVRLKNKLASMSYNDEAYDGVEDQLHELEDEFNEEFGEYLEDILIDLHDSLKSESDILLPTAYLAEKYVSAGEDESGDALFQIPKGSGVFVDSDNDGVVNQQLLLLPTPARFAIYNNGKFEGIVWKSKK